MVLIFCYKIYAKSFLGSLLCLGIFFVSSGCSKQNEEGADRQPVLHTIDEALADGRRQFHVRRCARCHGLAGLGGETGTRSARLKDIEKPASFQQLKAYPARRDPLNIARFLQQGTYPTARNAERADSEKAVFIDPDFAKKHRYATLSTEELLHISLYISFLIDPSLTSKLATLTPHQIQNMLTTLKNQ